MLFSHKSDKVINLLKADIRIMLGTTKLELVSQYKYLGIILDEKLLFVKHLSYLKGIISNKIYLLRKIRKYIDTKTALLLYKTLILSYFDLGDISYNSAMQKLLNHFQVLKIEL